VKEHVRVHVRHVHVHAHVMFTSHVGREGATCWTVDVLKEQHVGRVNMLHSFGPPSAFGRVLLSRIVSPVLTAEPSGTICAVRPTLFLRFLDR